MSNDFNSNNISEQAKNLVWFLTEKHPGSGDFYKPIQEEYSAKQVDNIKIDEILNMMYVALDYTASTPEPEEYEDQHIDPEEIEMASEYLKDLQATVPNVGSGLSCEVPKIADAKKPYILQAAEYMLDESKSLVIESE